MIKRIQTLLVVGGTIMMMGTTAGASDRIDPFVKGINAQAAAVGGAQVAIGANRSDSIYWNPAGLGSVSALAANASHSTLSDFDMNTDMVSIAKPIDDKSAVGFGLFYSSIDNIAIVPAAVRPAPTGFFSESELGLMLSYGRQVHEKVALGATLKYIKVDFASFNDSGMGIDLGAVYKPTPNFKAGINLQNVIQPDIGGDKVPFNAKIGVAYTSTDNRATVSADLDTNVLDESVGHLGLEYRIIPQIAARIGLNDGEFTAGIGLAGLESWAFDYAYSNEDVGDTHKISISYQLSPKKK